MLPQPER